MKKILAALLGMCFAMLPALSFAADISRAEAAPVEAYLAHFTGASHENLRFGSPMQPAEAKKMLEFALRFAQQDEPAKFLPCPRENCPYGTLRVEKRYVDEALKRYFGHNPEIYPLISGKDWLGFERGFYHTGENPEGTGLRPRVREIKAQPVGLLLIRGDVLDNMGEIVDKFSALAWPTKYGTQDSWSLVNLVYDSSKKKK